MISEPGIDPGWLQQKESNVAICGMDGPLESKQCMAHSPVIPTNEQQATQSNSFQHLIPVFAPRPVINWATELIIPVQQHWLSRSRFLTGSNNHNNGYITTVAGLGSHEEGQGASIDQSNR